ncbi:MAG: hypothetical protein JSU94_01385, partial [Phycisphaerales bacterium]
ATGYWTTWKYNTLAGVSLLAGTNTIRTTAIGSSGANIDHLKVSESHLRVNFQKSGAWIPSGFLPDYGDAFADRGNGYSYGWDIDITADARDRNLITDQKYDTLNHMQKAGNRTWEIALPNGTYDLVIGMGDPSTADFINNIDVEGTVITDPDPYDNFDEYSVSITVGDGRLTITTASGAVNAKICFVDIGEVSGGDVSPPSPDPMTWAAVPYATGTDSIAMEATPASDPSGVEYFFTCTAGGGHDSGWQDGTFYEDTGLEAGTTYTYTVTARDKSPAQNSTAPSTAESATTDSSCTPVDCHVESIECTVVNCKPPTKSGQVTVTIYDNCGSPVVGALVDGTFTGDFNETIYDMPTNENGQAVFVTAGCVKKPTYMFCVDDVTHGTLVYDSGDNVETCDSY